MSLAIVNSRAQVGAHATEVIVEVLLSRGLPSFSIVGLPETAVKESKDRVRGALINSNFEFPSKRISVNLAPADLPKEGGQFDLPIALGVLAASSQIPKQSLQNKVFLGELALSGELRRVNGGLTAAISLRNSDSSLVLPRSSACNAALVRGVNVYGVKSLLELTNILNGCESFLQISSGLKGDIVQYPDMSDVTGQEFPKFGLEVSASGAHSMIMTGSPGTGKTMLANRLPGILPAMTEDEALETAVINSILDRDWQSKNWLCRPFRAPHHSASGAALIGGGSMPRPGEISRAHNGVLFLDELTEFNQKSLDLLREPLEAGYVNISRAARQVRFLSRFIFIGAANPCKCGYLGDSSGVCSCTPAQVKHYYSKLSGPFLDRIDIQMNIVKVPYKELTARGKSGETSDSIRKRVIKARRIQFERQGKLNSDLSISDLDAFCSINKAENQFLDKVFSKLNVSARAYHRILKLARTIADMNDSSAITTPHLSAAVKLRCLDRM